MELAELSDDETRQIQARLFRRTPGNFFFSPLAVDGRKPSRPALGFDGFLALAGAFGSKSRNNHVKPGVGVRRLELRALHQHVKVPGFD